MGWHQDHDLDRVVGSKLKATRYNPESDLYQLEFDNGCTFEIGIGKSKHFGGLVEHFLEFCVFEPEKLTPEQIASDFTRTLNRVTKEEMEIMSARSRVVLTPLGEQMKEALILGGLIATDQPAPLKGKN